MRRYTDPAFLVFALAMLASMAIHLPIYSGLGRLADALFAEDARRAMADASSTVEFSFEDTLDDEVAVPEDPSTLTPDGETPSVDDTPQAREERRRPRRADREPEPEPEPEPEAEMVPAEAQPAPPPIEAPDRHAITQRSQDPNVEAPTDTQYLAEENNRVEEETVAEITNLVVDSEEPVAGGEEVVQLEDTEDEGNAAEDELADAREMEGDERFHVTPEEAMRERPEDVPEVAAVTPRAGGEPEPVGREDDRGQNRGADEREAEARSRERAQAGGGASEAEIEVVTVSDGIGTFVVRRRVAPEEGRGEGDGGGDASQASAARRGAARRMRTGGRGTTPRRGTLGEDMRLSWSQFEQVANPEELERAREAYAAERRTKVRGNRHARDWQEFRAALDNSVVGVQPGNQTSLNAAASPFANYIAAVHRRVHREFALKFLRGLPSYSSSPFSDPTLRTNLEIILNRDGTVHRIAVVETSGFLPFDYGAFAAVMRGQPYPAAPTQILSGDGRVYLRWGFYRGPRQCGVFNAQPYIIPHPPGSAGRSDDGLIDSPAQGGVIPAGSRATWGTEAEGGVPEVGHEGHEHGEEEAEPEQTPAPEEEPEEEPGEGPEPEGGNEDGERPRPPVLFPTRSAVG